MSVHKRKEYRSGGIWYYAFNAPGSTREKRRRVKESGFATKQEAIEAEAARRIEEQKKYEMAKAGARTAAEVPKTLATLLQEFLRQHVEEKLAPKTIERYHELAACLAPELLAMSLAEITPLHLNREWTRLLKSGGHHRRTKKARSLSAKTVRNIAGVVSSAFGQGDQMGAGYHESRNQQRAPGCKEADQEVAHADRTGHGVRGGHGSMVPADVPAHGGFHRRAPWGDPGPSLGGHRGRSSKHYAVAHSN